MKGGSRFKRSISEDKSSSTKSSFIHVYKKSSSIGSGASSPPSYYSPPPASSSGNNVHFNMQQHSPFIRRCMSIDPDSVLASINDEEIDGNVENLIDEVVSTTTTDEDVQL